MVRVAQHRTVQRAVVRVDRPQLYRVLAMRRVEPTDRSVLLVSTHPVSTQLCFSLFSPFLCFLIPRRPTEMHALHSHRCRNSLHTRSVCCEMYASGHLDKGPVAWSDGRTCRASYPAEERKKKTLECSERRPSSSMLNKYDPWSIGRRPSSVNRRQADMPNPEETLA